MGGQFRQKGIIMNIAMLMMAGVGSRFGAEIPKQFVKVDGVPIFCYVLQAYNDSDLIDGIVIVTNRDWIGYVEEWKEILESEKVISITAGGSSRSESVRKGLEAIADVAQPEDVLLIHDVTHPYMDEEGNRQVIEAVKECGGATLGQYQYDTVYQMNDKTHMIEKVVPRETIVSGASPEAFRFGDLYRIYTKADKEELERMTSAGAIALHYGIPMKVISGNVINLKITYKNDMETLKELIYKYFPNYRR